MKVRTIFSICSMLLLATMPRLGATQLPNCSASAPCYTIVNRQGTAGLAVGSSQVAAVYLNGKKLTHGAGGDYEVSTTSPVMLIIHMPANTSNKPEQFQVVLK